jgi:LysM repeat protein
MTKIKILFIGLLLSLFFSSCGAKKKVKKSNPSSKSTQVDSESDSKIATEISSETKTPVKISLEKSLSTLDYIEKYSNIAVAQMFEHDIPASIILAQGILESSSGNSDLTQVSNNHFGIKCHKNWTGARTYYDDDTEGECFRVYENPINSYNDHSHFLKDRKRYEGLFSLDKGDYRGWAYGLSKAGYATDKNYPQKLIDLIEKYELYKFDEVILGNKKDDTCATSGVYTVKKGDGLYGISKKFNLSVEELKRINNLDSNAIFPGQVLHTKPIDKPVVEIVERVISNDVVESKSIDSIPENVKDTIPPTKPIDSLYVSVKKGPIIDLLEFHIVKQGESLYQIAYKYNLEIPDLRRWNGIRKDEIRIGQKIRIKERVKSDLSESQNIETRTHSVNKGDTLYSISKKYGLSVSELKRLNNIKNNIISIGQVLIVK